MRTGATFGVLSVRGEPPPATALLRRSGLPPRCSAGAPRRRAEGADERAVAGRETGPRGVSGRPDLPQPDPLRRLVRPRRHPRRRRLLARRLELPRGAGAADPPLEGPRPLDARRARGAAAPLSAVRRPAARRRRLGPVDPLGRRFLPRLVRRPRPRDLHHPGPRPPRSVGAAPPREGGSRVDRPVPVPRRGRFPLARPRLGEEPGRIQRDPDGPPALDRRSLRRSTTGRRSSTAGPATRRSRDRSSTGAASGSTSSLPPAA